MAIALESKFTRDEARDLTNELRSDYGSLQVKISTAWKGRIWLALEYESWQDYLDAEFQDVSLRPPKEIEDQVVAELRSAGMSTRGIVAATTLSKGTVGRVLERAGAPSGAPASDDAGESSSFQVVGLDGKHYSPGTPSQAPRSPGNQDIVDAEIIDEDDFAERSVADLGLEPATVNLSPTGNTLGREHVIRAIHDLHFGASSPLTMVKKKSKLLETAFAGGMGDLETLDADTLRELGQDVADTVAVLSDLLASIANQRATTFIDALSDTDTTGSMTKAIRHLQVITGGRKN